MCVCVGGWGGRGQQHALVAGERGLAANKMDGTAFSVHSAVCLSWAYLGEWIISAICCRKLPMPAKAHWTHLFFCERRSTD